MIERVKCKWCDEMTDQTATKLCHRHWELSSRIEAEPELAQKMLDRLRSNMEEDNA